MRGSDSYFQQFGSFITVIRFRGSCNFLDISHKYRCKYAESNKTAIYFWTIKCSEKRQGTQWTGHHDIRDRQPCMHTHKLPKGNLEWLIDRTNMNSFWLWEETDASKKREHSSHNVILIVRAKTVLPTFPTRCRISLKQSTFVWHQSGENQCSMGIL